MMRRAARFSDCTMKSCCIGSIPAARILEGKWIRLIMKPNRNSAAAASGAR